MLIGALGASLLSNILRVNELIEQEKDLIELIMGL